MSDDADLNGMLAEIEAAAVRGWPAPEQIVVDGWIWRHASGGSIRANSVATVTYTGRDVRESIATIERYAKARKTAACFTVFGRTMPGDLITRLAARGYVRGDDHVTMAKRTDPHAVMPAGVRISRRPGDDWMDVYLGGLSPDRRDAAPRILDRLPDEARYVSALQDGSVVASGLTVGDGRLASVQCLATRPEARRRGCAQMVLAAIEALAAEAGREVLYLQTSGDNAKAQALYRKIGYVVICHYHTRTKSAAAL